MTNYSIEELSVDNEKEWDRFNENFEDGSFYHTLKWKMILEKSFNFKSHCFLVRHREEVISICPFYEVTIKGFNGLQLLPESDYNNLLIENKHLNNLILKSIVDKTEKIVKNNKLSFAIISTLNKKAAGLSNNYDSLPFPITGNMEVDLRENSPEKIWNDIFSKKDNQRKYIKRFDKDWFKLREIKSIKDLEIFYKYYKENLKFINAPPYLFSHFEKLLNTYSSSDIRITLLHKDEVIAGGLLAFLFSPKKTMYLRYLALNRQLPNKYHAPYYLYWDALMKASQMGYDKVSFGGTPNDSEDYNYRLKKKFGCSYKEIYSFILHYSTTFKFGYNVYRFIKKYLKYLPH